jgi:hypothetical protein
MAAHGHDAGHLAKAGRQEGVGRLPDPVGGQHVAHRKPSHSGAQTHLPCQASEEEREALERGGRDQPASVHLPERGG